MTRNSRSSEYKREAVSITKFNWTSNIGHFDAKRLLLVGVAEICVDLELIPFWYRKLDTEFRSI